MWRLVLALLVACAPGAPERRAVISVQRSFAEHVATGEVILLHASPNAALASPHQVLAAPRAWLALGDALDDTQGYAAYGRGLDELGDLYKRAARLRRHRHLHSHRRGRARSGAG